MAVWNSIISFICTRALHSFISFAHCSASSTVIPLLPKDTFTPSIQPNLGLPRSRSPLTSANNILLAIRYSSFLFTCPNILKTLWSALLANSLSITDILRTSSLIFINNSIHSWHWNQTSQTLHLRTFTFLLSELQSFLLTKPSLPSKFSRPSLLSTTPMVQLLLHIDTSWPFFPILYYSAHFSALPMHYTPHSLCVPHPFHILNQLPLGVADFLTDCREWLTWLDETKWLLTFRLTGLFRAHCASFHIHSFLLTFFLFIFNYFISILLFPCASVRENTRAWVPHFL